VAGQDLAEPLAGALSVGEMWSSLSERARDDLRARVSAAMPVRRMGTPDDIGQAALFLMTSPQTTGVVLEVSGGESLIDRLAA
jgi:NAD(P)-dependent dehydrogenase (short-subunit alcohol dehydrogenase family)